jgi:hypothetical protein
MADPRLVEYIRKVTHLGYSREQITSLLIDQGWHENEINEAFREALGASAITTEKTITEEHGTVNKKSAGFIASMLSGLLVILDGVMLRTSDIIGFTVIEIIDTSIVSIELIMLSLIFGLGIILGSVLIYKGKPKVGGILVILLSITSMITFIGLIVGLVGIIAGILGILRK